MRYEVKKEECDITVQARSREYSLDILDRADANISFLTRNPYYNRWVAITGRDLTEYRTFRKLTIDPSLVYVEVGAGLGEFIPAVVQKNPKEKPIVIDPADYRLMLDMLQFAELLPLAEQTKQKLRIYQERCKTILNPHKVRLVSSQLENVFDLNPELEGVADVVVDHFGALFYNYRQRPGLEDLERRLLKANGTAYNRPLVRSR
ncbi:MAG TPA: hypothetical protein VJA18_02605 [Candidatus Nanoarchaeia archaeon]|nr:hypothetical protein [Candidatus Nanoarchaeia archaeon]